MGTTNVPDIQWSSTGITLPAESAILAGVQADQAQALPGVNITDLQTPQGQLAQSSAAIIGDKNAAIAYVTNQVDPNNASGRFQDAIGAIYFIERIPGTGTVANFPCNGLVGTVIPAGSFIVDSAGNQYVALASGTIGSSGTVTIPFQNIVTGAIAVATGGIQIYKAVAGWESVTNPGTYSLGNLVETQAEFEFRRQNSVALNALNSPQAILAAVLNVSGVVDAYVIDNPTNATVNTGSTNYPVAANSVYVAVAGGAEAAVAQAIYSKKSLGCSYNGNTTYSYTDESSPAGPPYPTYNISYEVPNQIPIYIAVTLAANPNLPSNITQLVQAAVQNAFTGADGGQKARIAGLLLASRYYAGIAGISTAVEIVSVFIGTSASPTALSVQMGIDQQPTLNIANVTVAT
jgi:hypothetical protein